MDELFYGKEAWKSSDFGIVSAKQWLAQVPVGDERVDQMLAKVALYLYANILNQMDQFIKILMASKHRTNSSAVEKFFRDLSEVTLPMINPDRHQKRVVQLLLMNVRLKSSTVFFTSLISACLKWNLTLPSQSL